jgi:prepilin-type N-terminal cleavage/methylation domain-containing protein
MDRNKNRKKGFTLLELIVAVAISGTLGAAVFGYFLNSERMMAKNSSRSEIEQLALNLCEEMRNDLSLCRNLPDSGWDLIPNASFTGRMVTAYDYATETNTYGSTVIWRVEQDPFDPVNGADDDGDGNIDEMQLVRVLDGVAKVRCTQIRADGFTLTINGNVVTIQLFFSDYIYQTKSIVTFNTNPLSVTLQ